MDFQSLLCLESLLCGISDLISKSLYGAVASTEVRHERI